MKIAEDFRYIAREVLRGKWSIAVIGGLIASLLGGMASNESNVKVNLDLSQGDVSLAVAGQTVLSTTEDMSNHLVRFLIGSGIYIAVAVIVLTALYFVLGSVVETGYARFNLDLVDRTEVRLESLFSYFYRWKTTAAARLLKGLYIMLWSLLFFIPGIIASYSYAMTGYILAENPDLTANEAIGRSKEMMSGNRFRLFCLQMSFIGWGKYFVFTLGIGNLWLNPYRQAATAAFYREISGTEK